MDGGNVWDPALVQQLVALGSIPDQQRMLEQKVSMGREDSQSPMPKGYQVGNTYMAASPLEHLAAALQRGVGLAQQRRGMSDLESTLGEQKAGRSAYADALARMFAQQQQAQPAAADPRLALYGGRGTNG